MWERKNNKNTEIAKNTRKTVWSPTPKKNLLDRANAAIPSQTNKIQRPKLNPTTVKKQPYSPASSPSSSRKPSLWMKWTQKKAPPYLSNANHTKDDNQIDYRTGIPHPTPPFSPSENNTTQVQPTPFGEEHSHFFSTQQPHAYSQSMADNKHSPSERSKEPQGRPPLRYQVSEWEDFSHKSSPAQSAERSPHPLPSETLPHKHEKDNEDDASQPLLNPAKPKQPFSPTPLDPTKPYRRAAIALLIVVPLLGMILDPFLWQWRRLHTTVDWLPTHIPVLIEVEEYTDNSIEDADRYFQAIERLLKSGASAIGFVGPPQQWLPDPTDPIQYERLNQLLERYPKVVVGVPAKVLIADNHTRNKPSNESDFLSVHNLLILPEENFAQINPIRYSVVNDTLTDFLPRINVGFFENIEGKVATISNWATYPLIGRMFLGLPTQGDNNGMAIPLSASFAATMMMVSNNERLNQYRDSDNWFWRAANSGRNEIFMRSDGSYAPAMNVPSFPTFTWKDWLTKEAKAIQVPLQGRMVLVGKKEVHITPPTTLTGLMVNTLSWLSMKNETRSKSELAWQAQNLASISQGVGEATPSFTWQTLIGAATFVVVLGLSFMNASTAVPLLLLFFVISLFFSWLPGFSLWSSSLLSLLFIMMWPLWQKARSQAKLVVHNATAHEANTTIEDNTHQAWINHGPQDTAFAHSPKDHPHSAIVVSPPAIRQVITPVAIPPETMFRPLTDDPDPFDKIGGENHTIYSKPPSAVPAYLIKPTKTSTSRQYADAYHQPAHHPRGDLEQVGKNIREAQKVVVPIIQAATSSDSDIAKSAKALEKNTDTQGFSDIFIDHLESDSSVSQQMNIGRYQVERVLGKGAMGVVYLGLDPHINRKVAIKTVPLPDEAVKGENQQLAARFFREAQAAGKLAHPGIVTVYDAGLYQQSVYMAMEYLEGHDLSKYTDANHLLPIPTVLNIVARVAEALHFAHERGVVHRDVKPANIIFDSTHNVVKVTDFGIAHIHDAGRAMTQVLVGSPNYMSPEHLTGEPLDGRSDLFSLGVTLFVLCSGFTPFFAENVSRLMYCILNEPPRDIRHFRPDLPESIVAIINRALQKDRQYRYISGAAMAQDLLISQR